MKLNAVALWALALAGVVAALWMEQVGGKPPVALLAEADPLVLLVDFLLIAAAVVALIAGLASNGRSGLLKLAAWAPLPGALACAWGLFAAWQISRMAHATRFEVVAPGIAESIFPLSLGLLIAATAGALRRPH